MLACLRANLEPVPAADLRVPAELDFTLLLEMCRHHEVTPLVLRALERHGFGAAVLEPFRRDALDETRWALHLTQHALTLLRRFEADGVPVLLHKGVVLSHLLFADVGLRPTKDLDIVIPPETYFQAKHGLTELGYRGPLAYTGKLLDSSWETFFLRRLHHVTYEHPESGVSVELHWRLSPDYRGDALEPLVWRSLRDYPFFGVTVRVLAEPLLFRALCDHGAAHGWFRLKWLFDLAVLLDRGDGAAAGHLSNQVGTAHLLCAQLFGVESPSKATPAQRWLAAQVTRQFYTFPIVHTSGPRRYLYHLLLLESKNPVRVFKLFRYFFADHDQVEQHTRGWRSYRSSFLRLTRRFLARE